ncbi:hypothetical protein ACWKWU_04245 [Chitinophaga lutea]
MNQIASEASHDPSLTPSRPFSQLDNDGNEIKPFQKFIGGFLIVATTLFCIVYIIGHWPDRLPGPKEDIQPFYRYEWFNVVLDAAAPAPRMHLNTLLLILVASGGFLGNMLHIATSFTTFIGAGQFRKSWALWYWVKPFTAAGLALTLYFVFRGGFLNMNDTSVNINLYGVMTISILAGLFTDRATLKLKEVFEVLLRPKEDRPGALQVVTPNIREVKAGPLTAGKPAHITILGDHLKEGRITLSIEGQKIEQFNLREDGISFFYVLPGALASQPFVTLSVRLGEAQTPVTYQLKIDPQ